MYFTCTAWRHSRAKYYVVVVDRGGWNIQWSIRWTFDERAYLPKQEVVAFSDDVQSVILTAGVADILRSERKQHVPTVLCVRACARARELSEREQYVATGLYKIEHAHACTDTQGCIRTRATHMRAWGRTRHGAARHGGQAPPGNARHGMARHGQARPGMAWNGTAWDGTAWPGMPQPRPARPGPALPGTARTLSSKASLSATRPEPDATCLMSLSKNALVPCVRACVRAGACGRARVGGRACMRTGGHVRACVRACMCAPVFRRVDG